MPQQTPPPPPRSFGARLATALALLIVLPIAALIALLRYRAVGPFYPDLAGAVAVLATGLVMYGGLAPLLGRRYRQAIAARPWLVAPLLFALLVHGAVWFLSAAGDWTSVASVDLLLLATTLGSPALAFALVHDALDARAAGAGVQPPARPPWRRHILVGWLVVLVALPVLGGVTIGLCRGLTGSPSLRADDRRDLAHFCIQSRVAEHDSFLLLERAGDESSVPVLIDALGRAPRDAAVYDCTWRHLVDALYRITGQDLGLSHAAWRAWWEASSNKTRDEWLVQLRQRPDPARAPRFERAPGCAE